MYTGDVAVVGVGRLFHRALYRVSQPTIQILPNRDLSDFIDRAGFPVREGFGKLRCYLCACLAVDSLPLAAFCRVDSVLGGPPTILAAVDCPLTVTPLLLGHRLRLPLNVGSTRFIIQECRIYFYNYV